LAIAPELRRRKRRPPGRQAPAKRRSLVLPEHAGSVEPAAEALFPQPSMTRHEFLAGLHERVRPRTYLEIGVNTGLSLALSRCRAVGVDPAFTITSELDCPLRLFRMTSDDFFQRHFSDDLFTGLPVDLGFIDGMHLSDFAYRDFMNTERIAAPTSVVLLDDMLPRDDHEAARERHTGAWAGDVFKVAEILRRRRPDLTVVPVNTAPTGTVVVLGLDPTSVVLHDSYDAEFDYLTSPDPQNVPAHVLHRVNARDPRQVLASPLWSTLVEMRQQNADASSVKAAIASAFGAGKSPGG
jgi:hypothetical protein